MMGQVVALLGLDLSRAPNLWYWAKLPQLG